MKESLGESEAHGNQYGYAHLDNYKSYQIKGNKYVYNNNNLIDGTNIDTYVNSLKTEKNDALKKRS